MFCFLFVFFDFVLWLCLFDFLASQSVVVMFFVGVVFIFLLLSMFFPNLFVFVIILCYFHVLFYVVLVVQL